MTTAADRARRHALLIGIDEYPFFGAQAQLAGCVNDVELMASVLIGDLGFAPGDVRLLRNGEATRDGVLAALRGLLERAGAGDEVVVHYSGHGSRIADREGDKASGKDETLVPYDGVRSTGPDCRDVTDDEIHAWLLEMSARTPYVTLIFDSCHSGSIARDPFGAPARFLPADERPAAELPPSPIAGGRAAAREVGPSGWLPLSERYVLIAACDAAERAFESKSEPRHGALTFYLCQELRRPLGPDPSYRDLFERVGPKVTALYPQQHPQLEGARDRQLFGRRELRTMLFLPIRGRRDDLVTLGGGAAHGLTAGSEWAVHPPGTKQVDDGEARSGLVRVTAVRAVTADAEVVEEREAVGEGFRAIEHAHCYGDFRFAVQLAGDGELDELASRIDASPLLGLAGAGEAARMSVYAVAPRTAAEPATAPVPQLGAVTAPTWAVVGEDGELAMPLIASVSTDGVDRLLENLETLARHRFVLGLEDHEPENPLAGRLRVKLKRRRPGGDWQDAEAGDPGGRAVYEEGDRLGVEITNSSPSPLYVTVLDLGLTARIHLLHPPPGGHEVVAPEHTLRVAMKPGEEQELYVPAELPPTARGEAVGNEYVKVFATTHAADFTALVQAGVRGGPVPATPRGDPLDELLRLACTGSGRRDPRPVRSTEDERWTAVTRSFLLRGRRVFP